MCAVDDRCQIANSQGAQRLLSPLYSGAWTLACITNSEMVGEEALSELVAQWSTDSNCLAIFASVQNPIPVWSSTVTRGWSESYLLIIYATKACRSHSLTNPSLLPSIETNRPLRPTSVVRLYVETAVLDSHSLWRFRSIIFFPFRNTKRSTWK